MGNTKRKKRAKRLGWAAWLAAGAALGQVPAPAAAADVPGQTLIISASQWNDRQVNIAGEGESDILIYGGTQTGSLINLAIDGASNYISIYGGYYDGITEGSPVAVTGNVMEVTGGGSGWIVYDDPAKVSDAYTRLHIYDKDGGELAVNVIAGHAGLGEASGNVINLRGGLVNGYVIAAESKTGTEDAATRLHDNAVNLLGSVDLSWASVFGAALFDDATRSREPVMGTNNALNVYVKDVDVNELAAFNRYNFYLPEGTAAGDVEVNVNGGTETDISGSSILAVLPSSALLQVNDKVTLLQNYAGIPDSQETTYSGIHSATGLARGANASAVYDLVVEKQDESHVVLRLKGVSMNPDTKNIPQTRVPTLINRGGDFMAGGGADSAEAAGAQIYTPFFAATGSAMRHTTGSYVKMRGYSMVLGMSKKIETEKRRMLIAPMAEYGRGHYDAYLDSGMHGQGTNQYVGGGLVFRNTMQNGVFYEGSLRGGRMKVDYATNDFSFNGQSLSERFHSSSPYFGAHVGIGREVPWHAKDSVAYYGKFFYTHIGADDIRLTTGDAYHLSHVNSERLRLGVRYEYAANERDKFYAGLAWEHEFDGSSYAVYEGLRTDTPRIRGNSGMLELGWVTKPGGDDSWSIDVSCTGWVGRQRGLSGRIGINWMF